MGDVLVEREFYYLLYGILHVQLIRTPMTYAYATLPLNFRQVWGYPHKSGQNIKFVPFFTGNISFHVLDISKLKKVGGDE